MTRRVIFVDPEFWNSPPPREDNIVSGPSPVPIAHDIVQMIEAGEQ